MNRKKFKAVFSKDAAVKLAEMMNSFQENGD